MSTQKYRLPIVILGLCLIGLISFKDTGIFVKDFTTINKEHSQTNFEKHKEVPIIKENIGGYLVQKNSAALSIPTEAMIRTSEKIEIGFSDVEVTIEDNIFYGISKIDKIIKNEDSYYTLVKDETVFVKDFKNDYYIIVDKEGKEFKVKDIYIELSRVRDKVSRGNNLNTPNRGESVTKIATAAYNNLGKPYCRGGIGPNSFDCSGLTYSIYLSELDIKLERVSKDQTKNGFKIAREDLKPGDIVFFRTSGKKIAHVGLYIGDNNMIHASSGHGRVMITNINTSNYYNTRYVTGRRIIK